MFFTWKQGRPDGVLWNPHEFTWVGTRPTWPSTVVGMSWSSTWVGHRMSWLALLLSWPQLRRENWDDKLLKAHSAVRTPEFGLIGWRVLFLFWVVGFSFFGLRNSAKWVVRFENLPHLGPVTKAECQLTHLRCFFEKVPTLTSHVTHVKAGGVSR